ncbi:hypothetical protein ABMA28_002687 [Loxostege sticticalis]|uniref:Ubiquinone biosynthesis O-methyltransferase, mitochondrial n=1 Tax=Loxostege sticticalis TaxID=481309 RepID=A0ABD0SXP3_LOXSC
MSCSRITIPTVFKRFNCKISPFFGYSKASYSNAQPATTIDEKDVERYSQLNKIWWDPLGPVKALHSMNEIRVPFVRDGLVRSAHNVDLKNPLKNLKLLDIGCGGGILSEELAKIGAEVTGIDANKEMIDLAKHHSLSNTKLINKPNYSCTTIEDHVHDHKNYYDGVVASEIIEHVNNPELFVKASVEVLKPGGKLFFTTPNRTLISKIFIIWIAEYVLKAIPKGTHEHNKFVRPGELSVMLEKNNCRVELVRGIKYYLLRNKWTFLTSQSSVYALQARKME